MIHRRQVEQSDEVPSFLQDPVLAGLRFNPTLRTAEQLVDRREIEFGSADDPPDLPKVSLIDDVQLNDAPPAS